MEMKYLLVLIVALIPGSVLAQTADQIPQGVRSELASDLSSLQKKLLQLTDQSGDTAYGFGNRKITITKNSANVRAGASSDAKPLMKANFGDSFRVVDKVDKWYAVQFDEPTGGATTGWVQAADTAPIVTMIYTGTPAAKQDVFEEIVEQASRMKDKYRNNQYVTVTGFSVNVGVPPSMSINIEFKK